VIKLWWTELRYLDGVVVDGVVVGMELCNGVVLGMQLGWGGGRVGSWCLIADMRETPVRNKSGWGSNVMAVGWRGPNVVSFICAGCSTFLFGEWAVAAFLFAGWSGRPGKRACRPAGRPI